MIPFDCGQLTEYSVCLRAFDGAASSGRPSARATKTGAPRCRSLLDATVKRCCCTATLVVLAKGYDGPSGSSGVTSSRPGWRVERNDVPVPRRVRASVVPGVSRR